MQSSADVDDYLFLTPTGLLTNKVISAGKCLPIILPTTPYEPVAPDQFYFSAFVSSFCEPGLFFSLTQSSIRPSSTPVPTGNL